MTNHPLSPGDPPLDLGAIRAKLADARGPTFWRSLEEVAETPGFQEYLHREFPRQASEWTDAASRRSFLKLMAASLALAGVGGCVVPPEEEIVPYVRMPEYLVPGKPLYFSSALALGGYARGVRVTSHMGRPTKIEGNPDHPATLGASDVFLQAAILSLYDPDRSQVVIHAGRISTWDAFLATAFDRMRPPAPDQDQNQQPSGLRLLSETITSPSVVHQIEQLLERHPGAKWYQYEPAVTGAARQGARLAFGEELEPIYHLDRADVILALDADILGTGPAHIRYARQFAQRRSVRADQAEPATMNRLYAVESTPTLTGAIADHRLPLPARAVAAVARAVARELGVAVGGPDPGPERPGPSWIAALARDLERHPGTSLVIAGDGQPAEVHALTHAINHALGNIGQTVTYIEPVSPGSTDAMASIRELAEEIDAGAVELLIILGGNPVYTAPADLNFGELLFEKVRLSVHLSLYHDETSRLCHWHIPQAHELESWGDVRAFDGTTSLVQPLIAPLYGGKTALELVASLNQRIDRTGYELLREYWLERGLPGDSFEVGWRSALHDGLIAGTASPSKTPEPVAELAQVLETSASPSPNGEGLEIVFRPDPTVWDGRFANNGWLQELPKPLTKLTWDNAAMVSPRTASDLGLSNEEVVELRYQGRSVQAPVWILPGQPDGSVTVHLGYGRSRAGRVGTGAGFNANAIRTSEAPAFGAGLAIQKTGRRVRLATTQHHHSMEGRHLVRSATLEQYQEHPDFVHEYEHGVHPGEEHPSLYPDFVHDGYAWGMAVNLSACIGCNACVVGCQAENNIPIVGKEQVLVGREMHWIRIDRYYEGPDLDDPATYHQPMLCMHCEKAPCEVVCPVAATVHSAEGLNDMVYNRCVGTRYCSNNCPYKVRRFNFLQYADETTPSLKLGRNPNVTVRMRGVMEKCTYCVQRINAARIEARMEGSAIRDGEIVTACQQACPTQAIVFGDVNDPNSAVSRLKAEPLNYGLLTELNTKPRTTYLAKLSNPNPEIEAEAGDGPGRS